MEINIEKIMEGIKEDIKDRGLTNDIPDFDQIMMINTMKEYGDTSNRLEQETQLLLINAFVEPNRPLSSNHKILGPFIVFTRRIIRKMLRFYIEPIIMDQNHYNTQMAHTIHQMNRCIRDRDKQLELLNQQIERLVGKQKPQETRIQD